MTGGWQISPSVGTPESPVWIHYDTIENTYSPFLDCTGNPIVKLELRPPPTDYQIPGL
ncbi:unnamed protein product [marine sediment metagenome]|uniref:Uncharacterized protein n=1 Tax=marine sediment metagenome TaxID=412755 RepID=X1PBF7_9ZZZZ